MSEQEGNSSREFADVSAKVQQDYLRYMALGPTRQAEIARHFKVTTATVCIAIRRMRRDGLVEAELPGARFLHLTAYGTVRAGELARRYNAAVAWLSATLGLCGDDAEREADEIEHALSIHAELCLCAKFT